ncbi:hypothetical protein [Streptomyces sp. NPDC054786]
MNLFIAAHSHHDVRKLFRRLVTEGGTGDIDAENLLDDAPFTEDFASPPPERYEVSTEASTAAEPSAPGSVVRRCPAVTGTDALSVRNSSRQGARASCCHAA